ncbi:MAG: diacylglycerol kinase [Candidatus Omnitrophota bacterium]
MNFYKKRGNIFNNTFIHSVNAALEGIVHTFKMERNMRIHFLAGILVLMAGIYFNLPSIEFMLLCFAVAFVLVSEMFNTAIEHAVDLINDEYHPLAKISKDVAAGAVFVSAVNALVVGYILIVKRIGWGMDGAFLRIKQSPWHLTFITLLIVIGMVLFVKILRGEKTLLKGGMPSGHSAFAFAIWMVISLLTVNTLVSLLVFIMAVLVAKSRISNGVHTFWEVLAGSILGSLVAILVFQLLAY